MPASSASWLTFTETSGNISEPKVDIEVLVNASGLYDGASEVYDVVVTVFLDHQGEASEQTLSIPVRILVRALVALDQCGADVYLPRNATVGELTTFAFTARDM